MNTVEKVKQLVAEQLCIPTDDIALDTDLESLGADSIDVVEMLTTLEDEFGITIPDEKVQELRTVDAIVKVIENSKKGVN